MFGLKEVCLDEQSPNFVVESFMGAPMKKARTLFAVDREAC